MSRWSRALPAGPLAIVVLVGCQDAAGPGATVAFAVQPTAGVAGETLGPFEIAVQDPAGTPLAGPVTIELDQNHCDWNLRGTLTVALEGGRARFEDLSLDEIGHGFALRASFGSASAVSQPFTVTSPVTNQPLAHEDLLCPKPNDQADAEALTWVPEDDALWLADDDRVSIFQIDRRTGRTLSRIANSEVIAALPGAGQCDDGDGDPRTTCSYTDEFEQVTYDAAARILYVVNTVNSSGDRPAVFRLDKRSCAGCFTVRDWQPLPQGPRYSALVVADGDLFVGHRNGLYRYDYVANSVATVDQHGDSLPPTFRAPAEVVGLAYDGSSMWVLSERFVQRVRWSTKQELVRYDVRPFGITTPRGVEAIRDTVYVLEGEPPNPINVLRIR